MTDDQATEIGQRYIEREDVERKIAEVSDQIRGYAAACERAARVLGTGGGWASRRGRLILQGRPRQGQPIQRKRSALGFDISETQDLEFPPREDVIKALEAQKELLAKKRELDRFFASRKT